MSGSLDSGHSSSIVDQCQGWATGRNPSFLCAGYKPPRPRTVYSEDERRAPLRALLADAGPRPLPGPRARPRVDQAQGPGEAGASGGGGGGGGGDGAPLEELSGTQLRDRLIAANPLDRAWIARVNQVPLRRTCLKLYPGLALSPMR